MFGKKKEKEKRTVFSVLKKILGAIGIIVILFLMATCAFLIYQRATKQEPSLFGYQLFEVQSASMEPTIMTLDTILTKRVGNYNDLKIDDIVVFQNDAIWDKVGRPDMRGNYIVHRIKKIEKGEDGNTYIVTRGDNNDIDDPPTKITAVFAIYVTKFGAFFRFIRSPFGIIAIVALIVAIFAAMRLVYAYTQKKKKKQAVLEARRIDEAKRAAVYNELLEEEKGSGDAESEEKPDAADNTTESVAEKETENEAETSAADPINGKPENRANKKRGILKKRKK